MNDATLFCLDEKRRHQVRLEGYNGLDYLEVSEDQLQLSVYLLDKVPATLVELIKEDKKKNTAKAVKHFRISGGRRVSGIQIIDVTVCQQRDPEMDDCLVLTVDRPGDFSPYTLCLVALDEDGRPTDQPYPNFDPRYACLDFSFKENCPNDLDCRDVPVCPPELPDEPEINYLAKDYASFRQLILDRLATIMPDWQERHVPDLGITLVELLA
ncbi:MAG: putative baseplate assembly protein, partial [Bacteroidetes bacterium]